MTMDFVSKSRGLRADHAWLSSNFSSQVKLAGRENRLLKIGYYSLDRRPNLLVGEIRVDRKRQAVISVEASTWEFAVRTTTKERLPMEWMRVMYQSRDTAHPQVLAQLIAYLML